MCRSLMPAMALHTECNNCLAIGKELANFNMGSRDVVDVVQGLFVVASTAGRCLGKLRRFSVDVQGADELVAQMLFKKN
jgi:hypothetical protein